MYLFSVIENKPHSMEFMYESEIVAMRSGGADAGRLAAATGDIADDGSRRIPTYRRRQQQFGRATGFKVYPNEVEGTVAAQESVLEVGAVGVRTRIPAERSSASSSRTLRI
jgi:hypothetical protein